MPSSPRAGNARAPALYEPKKYPAAAHAPDARSDTKSKLIHEIRGACVVLSVANTNGGLTTSKTTKTIQKMTAENM